MRGILLVDVHVLMGWWRLSCSLTISPWHVTSRHRTHKTCSSSRLYVS